MAEPIDPPDNDLTISIGAGDQVITNANKIAGIYCNAAGTIMAALRQSSTVRPWVVTAGATLLGDFRLIQQSGTTLVAANDMIGLRNVT
jgi:hypothetical protein